MQKFLYLLPFLHAEIHFGVEKDFKQVGKGAIESCLKVWLRSQIDENARSRQDRCGLIACQEYTSVKPHA